MAAYYKRLTGDDEEAKLKCASAWYNHKKMRLMTGLHGKQQRQN